MYLVAFLALFALAQAAVPITGPNVCQLVLRSSTQLPKVDRKVYIDGQMIDMFCWGPLDLWDYTSNTKIGTGEDCVTPPQWGGLFNESFPDVTQVSTFDITGKGKFVSFGKLDMFQLTGDSSSPSYNFISTRMPDGVNNMIFNATDGFVGLKGSTRLNGGLLMNMNLEVKFDCIFEAFFDAPAPCQCGQTTTGAATTGVATGVATTGAATTGTTTGTATASMSTSTTGSDSSTGSSIVPQMFLVSLMIFLNKFFNSKTLLLIVAVLALSSQVSANTCLYKLVTSAPVGFTLRNITGPAFPDGTHQAMCFGPLEIHDYSGNKVGMGYDCLNNIDVTMDNNGTTNQQTELMLSNGNATFRGVTTMHVVPSSPSFTFGTGSARDSGALVTEASSAPFVGNNPSILLSGAIKVSNGGTPNMQIQFDCLFQVNWNAQVECGVSC